MSKTQTIPLASLVEDMEIYPRHAVDDANVQSLALAIEAGANIPPIVVDAKSKRITDGWHRCRAYRRVYGPEATVLVELRNYKNEREMLEDSVRMNAAHGRRMDVVDQTRSVLMLEKLGATSEEIAVIMHVTEKRVEKLRLRVASCPSVNKFTVPGTNKVTLKPVARHLSRLNGQQAKAHVSMPGTPLSLPAMQIRKAIEADMINRDDERLMAELRKLYEALGTLLVQTN